MFPGKKLHIFIFSCLFISIVTVSSSYAVKSVYVISDTVTSQIQAYKVEDTNLAYQTDYFCRADESETTGAVGLAIDPDSEFLFVTLEGMDEIELVDAKTMQYVDIVFVPGASDLAGIVMDTDSKVLFDLTRFSGIIIYNSHEKCRKMSSVWSP